jgi:hypothetical protein
VFFQCCTIQQILAYERGVDQLRENLTAGQLTSNEQLLPHRQFHNIWLGLVFLGWLPVAKKMAGKMKDLTDEGKIIFIRAACGRIWIDANNEIATNYRCLGWRRLPNARTRTLMIIIVLLLPRFDPHLHAILSRRNGARPLVAVGLLSFVQACRQPLF